MCVAVPGDDRRTRGSGRRASRRVAGAEGERAAAHAGQNDEIDVMGRHPQPGDRPGVGPRPRPRPGLATGGPGPGSLQQVLSEPSLEVDPGALAELLERQHGEEARHDDQDAPPRHAFVVRRATTPSAPASRSAASPSAR